MAGREFDIIERYFLQLSEGREEAAGFKNDGAVLDVPGGYQLVVTSDTLNAGTHFLADQSSDMIAAKALRTNLSDLASMGAKPYCYQLCLALPEANEDWISVFCRGLMADQNRYGIFLSGGDTTSIDGPLSISITAFGLVKKGEVVTRNNAKPGDKILVSGTIGDAWCGLEVLRGNLPRLDGGENLITRSRMPEPPVILGAFLSHYAHAALDISDGLAADLNHMAKASGLRAIINVSDIPFSKEAYTLISERKVMLEQLITGGDDYELVMAVPGNAVEDFLEKAQELGIRLSVIGEFVEGKPGSVFIDPNSQPLSLAKNGWQHF